jgi:hypothetical protein
MIENIESHNVNINMLEPILDEVSANTNVSLNFSVSCPLACDLRGKIIKIVDENGILKNNVKLCEFDGLDNKTNKFVSKAPEKAGKYIWNAEFCDGEARDIVHGKLSLPFSFIVMPHFTKVEIASLPSIVEVGSEFLLNLRVQCNVQCNLKGKKIEIYDHNKIKVTETILDSVIEHDSGEIYYCASVKLLSPNEEKRYRWTAKFSKVEADLIHDECYCPFSFGVVQKGNAILTIRVVDKETMTPSANAFVTIRPQRYRGSTYKCRTNGYGEVTINLSQGVYQIYSLQANEEKECYKAKIEVNGNAIANMELVPLEATAGIPYFKLNFNSEENKILAQNKGLVETLSE